MTYRNERVKHDNYIILSGQAEGKTVYYGQFGFDETHWSHCPPGSGGFASYRFRDLADALYEKKEAAEEGVTDVKLTRVIVKQTIITEEIRELVRDEEERES